MKAKRWIALVLCILIGITMVACGSGSNNTNGNKAETNKRADGVIFDQDGISITVNGLRYQDYFWYIDMTVQNDTNQAIKVHNPYCTLNGYSVYTTVAIECDAKSTTSKLCTIDKASLCYLYELCGVSSVDCVGMTFEISANDETIAETDAFSYVDIEPFTIVETAKDALDATSVYNDDTYKVSVITVDNDFYGLSKLPMLYLLVENNGSSAVDFDFVDDPVSSYNELLENMSNGRNTLEINGQFVECDDMIYDPSWSTKLLPGTKTILAIYLYLEDAGIQIEDISNIKRDFEIVSMETENFLDPLASFTLEYTK